MRKYQTLPAFAFLRLFIGISSNRPREILTATHSAPIFNIMSLLTSYPGKALWVLGAVIATLAKLPFITSYYFLQRPYPTWTIRQASMNYLLRSFLYHSAVVEAKTLLMLDPGSEGERLIKMPPVGDAHLKGVLNDKTIRPVLTGGTWYPSLPPKTYKSRVILHFHGGGYAIGEGRAADASYAGKTLRAIRLLTPYSSNIALLATMEGASPPLCKMHYPLMYFCSLKVTCPLISSSRAIRRADTSHSL